MNKRIIKSCGNIETRTKRMCELGLYESFEKYESNEETCIKCINYKIKYGKYPSAGATDIKIRRLGEWLGTMRGAYHNKNKSKFDKSLLEVAERLGMPDMFDYINYEIKQLTICMNFIKFVKLNNRIPSHSSNNSDEKDLAIWLSRTKLAKQGKNSSRFFYSIEKLLIASDLDYVLTSRNMIIYNNLVTFLSMHGRYPTQDESPLLCDWLTYMRRMNKKEKFIHSNLLELAKKDGYPDMFSPIDIDEQLAVTNCKKLIEFILRNGRYPYQNKNPKSDEYKLSKWIIGQRNNSFIRPILKNMAIEAGFQNMFNSNWKTDVDYTDNRTITKYNKMKCYINNNDIYDKNNIKSNQKYSFWIRNVKSNSLTTYNILHKKSIDDNISIQFIYILNETTNKEEYDIKKMKKGITNISCILLHLHKYNTYPTSVTDRLLRKWLDKMRQSKKGNNNNKFYNEYDKIACDAGYHNMFNSNWRDDLRK